MIEDISIQEIQHPQLELVHSEVPCYRAYQRQMQLILSPAVQNVARNLVECTMDGIDPALKVTWMAIEEIRQDLRNEGMRFNGVTTGSSGE